MSDASVSRKIIRINGGREYLGALAAVLVLVLAIILIDFGVKLHRRDAQLADTQKQLAQAKTDGTQAQTELDQAKAAAGDLQSQLTQAKSKETTLQAQLDQSKGAAAEQQAQLDRAKSQSADLQAQLDKAKSESTALEAQLVQANSGSSQLLTELDQAKIQSMDLQSRLQKAESDLAQLQPLLLKARRLPVTTSLERVPGGRSFTLHIDNLYLQPVTVDITITGPDKTRSQSKVIGSGATVNVEKLAAGEKVAIASEGYDPVTLTVQ